MQNKLFDQRLASFTLHHWAEIMYSVAHAVHHYALIGVMGGIMGLPMPAGFGVAPSTLSHQAQVARIAA